MSDDIMTLDLDGIKDAIEAGINGDDRFRDTRGEALSALAVLIAEVERLENYASDCEQHAKFAANKATALERAAVVAWLRSVGCRMANGSEHEFVLLSVADAVENGEHRREED